MLANLLENRKMDIIIKSYLDIVMPKKSEIDISVIEVNEYIEPDIATGFDRGIDYEPMKNRLIQYLEQYYDDYVKIKDNNKCYASKLKNLSNKMVYNIIAMIQLRNGSRISEACNAFSVFTRKGINSLVTVKIAKSESIKYRGGEKIITKPRYRKMLYPEEWISNNKKILPILIKAMEIIPLNRLKKRVLDYLLIYHQCNTHSLRYACINYLIYEKARPLNDVAKFVGHIDLSMLTKYTQQKNCDKIFELDM